MGGEAEEDCKLAQLGSYYSKKNSELHLHNTVIFL